MEYLEIDSSSSSYSSSSSSSSSSCKPCSPDSESSADAQAMPVAAVSHKRKAGRKKFKETRHPVFRGVRQRRGNKWVCEVREPHKKSRIWLGTFPCPEMAARAYDVSALALRGKSAALNFPDSASILPRAASSSPKDIQTAALAAAEAFRPITTCCSPPGCSSSIPTSNEKKPCLVEETQPEENIDEQKKDLAYSSILDHWENLEPKANQCNLFIDEEALFNMPGFLDNMAAGMLLSPPPLMQRQVDWDDDRVATINIDLWGYQFTN